MIDPSTILPIKRIRDFCKKYSSIARLSLFGSVLTGDLKPDSDIDFLIEFEKEKTPSLFTIVDMECELTDLIGRKVFP